MKLEQYIEKICKEQFSDLQYLTLEGIKTGVTLALMLDLPARFSEWRTGNIGEAKDIIRTLAPIKSKFEIEQTLYNYWVKNVLEL